jgi:sarcosine oxidase delta subunit
MSRCACLILLGACVASACGSDDSPPTSPSSAPAVTFFVTSTTSVTGNLGGIRGADATCQRLATAAGHGRRSWRAYLSVEHDPDNGNRPTDARDRVGSGSWFNINRALVASDISELHARRGDAALFLDEHGQRINGQWPGSPRPVEHDILTGSTAEGRLMPGMTCADWTSDSTSVQAQVGHSDGLGPNGDTSGTLSSWNSAHANQNCANTAPRGGAGRFYCFARN